MTTIHLTGSITSALSHLALLGAATIADHELGITSRIHWSREPDPRPALDLGDATPTDLAAAIHKHATQANSDDSWLSARLHHEGRDTAALSPRIKVACDLSAWNRLQTARHQTIDGTYSGGTQLDLLMIGALGEPAYWRERNNSLRPDEGASRWEMKTRNKGEEFVGNRLHPLARTVAQRTPSAILDGLTGNAIHDELGGNKPESRSATGLTTPGPVDNALAWCALWGIINFPVVQRLTESSATAGSYPHNRIHPDYYLCPAPTIPITLARVRTITASRHLLASSFVAAPIEPEMSITIANARTWLAERGVAAVVKFPVKVAGSTSAPERMLLDGTLSLTGEPS